MNPEVTKMVQQLADKLGVTAQYLWSVLVRGNRVEGVICAAFVALGAVAIYAGIRLTKHALSDAVDTYDMARAVGLLDSTTWALSIF